MIKNKHSSTIGFVLFLELTRFQPRINLALNPDRFDP